MFFKLVIFYGLVTIALSAPGQQQVQIVSQSNEVNPDGSFKWQFQTEDGTLQEQSGQLVQLGHDAGQVMQGGAAWYDPEGKPHSISYVADENGYQPQSDDLPVPPEIPKAILRALEWIAVHPQPENQQ